MRAAQYSKIISSTVFAGYFWYCVFTQQNWHFIDGVNLIFHEAGHAICFLLPALLTAAAGSGFQILIPLVCVFYFWKRREVVSAGLVAFWLAQNFMSVSMYMRDAIPMQLPLLGGDSSTHDWHFIFTTLGILPQSIFIADSFVTLSYICLLGSTAWVIRYLYQEIVT